MKRYFILLAALCTLVMVWGCTSVGSTSPTGSSVLAQLDDANTGVLDTLPAVLELNGKPALLYVNKENRLIFRHADQLVQLDDLAPVKGGTSYQLHMQDGHLQAFWWSHEDAKNLYMATSTDAGKHFSPATVVNDDHGVLPFFSVLHGSNGVVGVSYLDERKPNFSTYFNRSTNYGGEWPKPDQRLDVPPVQAKTTFVRDPQTVQSGDVWVSAWVDSVFASNQTRYRLVIRRSEDAGQTWAAPQEIFSADTLIASLKLRVSGKYMVVAADEHGKGIFAYSSEDQGHTWHGAGHLPNTGFHLGEEGASNNGLAMVAAGDRAHLVWMQERKNKKPKVMQASYDMARSQWVGAVRWLDLKSHENTMSLSPTIAVAPNGAVVAAWVDYRDIRPNIYLSASFDNGHEWSAPQALLKPGEVSAGWPRLMPWRDQIAIAYEVYPADRPKNGRFVLQQIPLAQDSRALPQFTASQPINEADKRKRLEQRVKALWDARVARNYEAAYHMFDFAYRIASTLKSYLDNVGTITYMSYSIDGYTIDGNEAKVKSKLKYEVKETMLPTTGKPIKLAPVDVEIENTWVWVGDDWYLVYSPSFDKPLLKY